jgi:photosystem II stability/assembly factor-like uncharacterized protein
VSRQDQTRRSSAPGQLVRSGLLKLTLAILTTVLLLAGALLASACGSARPTAADYVWAVGESGTIRASTDGGRHWVSQHSGTSLKLVGVAFADRSHGWAVGQDLSGSGGIVGTSDGGSHLHTEAARQLPFWSIACAGADHAWAVADGDTGWVILATTDGGQHWATQALAQNPQAFHRLVFVDARHGWVVGIGQVLATADGGLHWRRQLTARLSPNGGQEFDDLDFCDARHGFLVGADFTRNTLSAAAVWSTSDGGATWRELPGPSDEISDLYRVAAIDPAHLVVSGDGAWFSSDTGRRWTPCTLTFHGETKITVGGLGNDFAFATPTLGWSACTSILATTDGGANWRVASFTAATDPRHGIDAVACVPRTSSP